MSLKGFTSPRTPEGRSSLVPYPPWHYVGAFLVVGIISGFAFQVLYNITMSAGLAPVKGLTLPLMSYGGSSLVATMAGFGLILNVRMRRFTN